MTPEPLLTVHFYQTSIGHEPVRKWLRSLPDEDRRQVGIDIKVVQFGWPMGLPMVRKLEPGLWEVRTLLANGIARVFFTVIDHQMILLHGFIKKSTRTPLDDLDLARRRLAQLKGKP